MAGIISLNTTIPHRAAAANITNSLKSDNGKIEIFGSNNSTPVEVTPVVEQKDEEKNKKKEMWKKIGLVALGLGGVVGGIFLARKFFGDKIKQVQEFAQETKMMTQTSTATKAETAELVSSNSVQEIKFEDDLFDFLPWKGKDYRGLPHPGKPPEYTQEAKRVTESFVEKGWVEEPLPNGFRMAYGPYKLDNNGMLSHIVADGGEILYYNAGGKGTELMVERLQKIFSDNPSISDEQKARILYKFVDSCYDRRRAGWVSQFSPDFISIVQTAASGSGVCRHKSFLAKILGDRLGLDVSMVRGWYTVNTELGISDSHIWNEVKIGSKKFLMDVEQGRFEDLAKFKDFSKLYEYAHAH